MHIKQSRASKYRSGKAVCIVKFKSSSSSHKKQCSGRSPVCCSRLARPVYPLTNFKICPICNTLNNYRNRRCIQCKQIIN